ncbi:MAG: hypothetical protein KAH38_02155 [Candidatus Hydrogenedentes bacterium]|nr:hypothetical protein [Candidatus Hydrogenedentota bacterium]
MPQVIDKTTNRNVTDNETLKRDSEMNIAVGLFLFVLGIPVSIGTFWALDRPNAAIVNAVCGGVLLLIGAGVIAYGWRGIRKAAKNDS